MFTIKTAKINIKTSITQAIGVMVHRKREKYRKMM